MPARAFSASSRRIYLKLYPRPAVCGTSVYLYPFDLADEVFTWARAVGAEVDPRVELQAVASRGEPNMGIDSPGHLVCVARVRRLRGGGRKGPRPVRHLPGRRQGARQSSLYANRFAHLV